MGRKHVVYGYKPWDSASLATSQTSSITEVGQADYGSIYVYWTGSSPVGTLEVQGRNGDKGTWHTLDFGGTISVSGASGNHELILNEIPFTSLRLVYTRTSGTGSISAEMTLKSKGA